MNRRAIAAGGLAGLVAVGAASGVRPTRTWVRDEYHHVFGPDVAA